MQLADVIGLFSQDLFVSLVLFVLMIFYGFFAVVLFIQITTYNRIMTQTGFSSIFQLLGFLHILIAVSLLLLTIVTI